MSKEIITKSLRQSLNAHRCRFISRIETVNKDKDKANLIGQNTLAALQALLGRSLEITRGMRNSKKTNNLIMLALAIRAHIETTGTLCSLYYKINDFYQNKCTSEELTNLLLKIHLGSKTPIITEKPVPSPVHVNSGLEKLDNFMKDLGMPESQTKLFEEEYDFLSDLCHPNFNGNAFCYSVDKKRAGLNFLDSNKSFKEFQKGIYPSALISSTIFFNLYDKVFNVLKSKETFPITRRPLLVKLLRFMYNVQPHTRAAPDKYKRNN